MELRKISIEDVFPDEKNPRKDFGDIKALAESFELNKLYPGEPVNPIIVVQDGGIYRIVDGERRYRAMLKNKLEHCHAVVCEDMDEANAQIAMLTTNDKQQLTELERSRGVQQMMLLGVDPVKIEKAARIPGGSASKVATAMAKVDDAAEDMTLDRLYVIAEFADDQEAVEKLMNCRESEWKWLSDNLREKKKKQERLAAMKEYLDAAEIPIVKSHDGLQDHGYATSVDVLKEKIAEIEDAVGLVAYCDEGYGSYDLYSNADDAGKAPSPEALERQEKITETGKAIVHSSEKRDRFFFDRIESLDAIPNIMELVEDSFFKYNGKMIGSAVHTINKAAGFEINTDPNELTAALGYAWLGRDLGEYRASNLVDADPGYAGVESFKKHLILLDAFLKDGYEFDDMESAVYELCKTLIEKEEEADNGEDQ